MVAMDVTSLQAYCLAKPGAWPADVRAGTRERGMPGLNAAGR